MGEDGDMGGGLGLGDIAGSIDTSGASLGGGGLGSGLSDYSESFGSMDLGSDPGFSLAGLMDNLDTTSMTLGYDDPASFSISPNMAQGYEDINLDDSVFGRISQFMQSPIGKLGMMALSKANPAIAAAMSMVNRGYQASQSPAQAGRAIGGMTGSQVGGSIAGLPGSIVGGMIGGWGGQQALGGLSQGYSGPSMGQQAGAQGGSPNMDMMTGGLAGLASLYQGMRNSREIGGQLNGLQSLYGQNSPYAQQLRQALARQDAKSGRRSQYGPREVELQARLAQMASGQAGTMANLMQMQQANRGQSLAQLAGLYQQMGGMNGIRGGLDQLFNGFGGGSNGIPADMPTLAPYEYGNLNPENYYSPIPDIPDFGGDWGG